MIAWLVLLQASLTIAVAGPATSPDYLPLHVAQAEGLFTAQNLTVTLRPYRSEPSAAEALAPGDAARAGAARGGGRAPPPGVGLPRRPAGGAARESGAEGQYPVTGRPRRPDRS